MSLLLKNRYQVLEVLSEVGGFGQTFLAEDTDTPSRRKCVIKKLRPVADAEDFKFVQERFQREAAILERLGDSCDQIPKLYAYFVENQEFYLVQELIDGFTLKQKLQREGTLDENTVKDLLLSLLDVLEYVHSQNIIHRDIKPDNVIVRRRDNKPVLIDFGIVKEVLRVGVDGSPTSSIMAGTPGYTASEQAAGRPVYASDLYSLGAMAIYLLTGRNPQQMTELAAGDIAWQQFAPQVSTSFAAVINKATELHVRDRYKTNAEMREDLEGCLAIPEPPPKPIENSATKPKPFVNPVPNIKSDISPNESHPDNPETSEILTEIRSTSSSEKPKRKWFYLAFPVIALLLFAIIGGSYWITNSGSNQTLIPFRKGDKFGFSDVNKKIVIAPKYDYAEPFADEIAVVSLNKKFGLIDKTGKEIVPPKYDTKIDFNEGLSNVEVNGKHGYIDTKGREIVPLIYDEASKFSEGLASVRLGSSELGKSGYIDKTGNVVIPIKYDSAGLFNGGLANIKLNNKEGFINKSGNVIITLNYDFVFSFAEGLACVKLNDKCGFIDTTGNLITSLKYDDCGFWVTDGMTEAKLNGKYGLIDKNGDEIIPFKYENVGLPSEGLIDVQLNGKNGFVDSSDNVKIPFKYDNANGFREGLAAVKLNGKFGFIDKTGKEIIKFKYGSNDEYNTDMLGTYFKNGLARVTLNGKNFYIDKNGTEYYEP